MPLLDGEDAREWVVEVPESGPAGTRTPFRMDQPVGDAHAGNRWPHHPVTQRLLKTPRAK